MINALTIDVEDYFQVPTRPNSLKGLGWEKYVSRVERNTYRILALLNNSFRTPNPLRSGGLCRPEAEPQTLKVDPLLPHSFRRTLKTEHRTKITATFFCLGWIAKKFPHLIKEIHAQGHEVACHGYTHHLIFNMSKEEFRRDIRKAKGILEDLTGDEVIGYRAPCFSITQKSLWALKILAEEGYKYDSSILPIHHEVYGIPEAPRFPFWISLNGNGNPKFELLKGNATIKQRTLNIIPKTLDVERRTLNFITEFPPSTFQLVNTKIPISNGGYSRLLPYFIFKTGLLRINRREGQPFIIHLHPWELNFDQHRTNRKGWKLFVGQSGFIEKKEKRFRTILEEFPFSSLKTILSLKITNLQTDPGHSIYFNQSSLFSPI